MECPSPVVIAVCASAMRGDCWPSSVNGLIIATGRRDGEGKKTKKYCCDHIPLSLSFPVNVVAG
jgi:hypothetical protein